MDFGALCLRAVKIASYAVKILGEFSGHLEVFLDVADHIREVRSAKPRPMERRFRTESGGPLIDGLRG